MKANLRSNYRLAVAAICFLALWGGKASACSANPAESFNAAGLRAGFRTAPSTLHEDAQAPSADSGRTIVGLWDVNFYDDTGAKVDEAYEQFHSDGQELMTDTSAPATDNVCIGIWEQVGAGAVKLKHVSFGFDLGGNLQYTAIFRTAITVDVHGNTFQGTTQISIYDLSGNLQLTLRGTVKGTRITIDF